MRQLHLPFLCRPLITALFLVDLFVYHLPPSEAVVVARPPAASALRHSDEVEVEAPTAAATARSSIASRRLVRFEDPKSQARTDAGAIEDSKKKADEEDADLAEDGILDLDRSPDALEETAAAAAAGAPALTASSKDQLPAKHSVNGTVKGSAELRRIAFSQPKEQRELLQQKSQEGKRWGRRRRRWDGFVKSVSSGVTKAAGSVVKGVTSIGTGVKTWYLRRRRMRRRRTRRRRFRRRRTRRRRTRRRERRRRRRRRRRRTVDFSVRRRRSVWIAVKELITQHGNSGPTGTAAVARNGWSPLGGVYGSPRCDLRSGVAFVSGGLGKGTWSWLLQLGTDCRPAEDLAYLVDNHEKSSSVAVYTNGSMKYLAGGDSHEWVSVSGVVFATSAASFAHLYTTTGWMGCHRSYGYWADARYTLVHGMCVLEGMICRNPELTNDVIATLPGSCRPRQYTIFGASQTFHTQRIDASAASGELTWKEGAAGTGWLSLGGIIFATSNAYSSPLPLAHSWYASTAYPGPPTFTAFNGYCVLGGVIAGGTGLDLDVAGRLPSTCRPDRRLIFLSFVLETRLECRIDIMTTGEVVVVVCRNQRKAKYSITLGGIAFSTPIATLMGPDGAIGKDGKDGDRGKTGMEGKNGRDGARGPPGPSGGEGAPGDTGQIGQVGNAGSSGLVGIASSSSSSSSASLISEEPSSGLQALAIPKDESIASFGRWGTVSAAAALCIVAIVLAFSCIACGRSWYVRVKMNRLGAAPNEEAK